MLRTTRNALLALIVATAFVASVAATEPPDSQVNPVTGSIETVESVTASGQTNVRHSVDPGQGGPTIVLQITSSASPDLAPRIAIRADGRSAVTWWRDDVDDVVLLRTRDPQSGTWTTATPISAAGTGARNPEIVSDGSSFWIVYEIDRPGGETGIEVRNIVDDPIPVPSLVATTSYAGDLDSLVHFEAGRLWVTWIDGTNEVGWSVYDFTGAAWATAAYESYAADSVEDARARIRARVMGG